MRLVRMGTLLIAVLAILAGCGEANGGSANTSAGAGGTTAAQTLKIGASPVPHGEILNYIKDNLAAGAGLQLEVIEFTDYVQPNIALGDGQIDANFFQHVPYMDEFARDRKLDLVAVAAVHIEPLGIYSKKVTALADVADGAVVAIPNDPTNAGRSLLLLADNGLITLKDNVGVTATVQDITANPKQLEITELDAAQLPRSLDDTTLSVINGNYALEVGLKPSQDALALEKAANNPYANVLAVVKGHESDPNIQKLVKLLTSPEVKKFIEDKYQGVVIPAF
jgi:D-methionine transport system substrate-binding protein